MSVVVTVGFFTFTSERIYEASATLSIRQGGDLHGQLFNIPSVFHQKYLVENQVAALESHSLAVDVVRKLQESTYKDSLHILGNGPLRKVPSIREKLFSRLVKRDSVKKKPSFQGQVNGLISTTKVSYSRDSDIIELKGRAPSPWEAAYIVNTWVEAYQNYNRSDTQGEVRQTKRFLETKLKEMERKLALSEEGLTEYQKREKVISLPNETEQLVAQLASFESLYNQTKTELEAVENKLSYLKNQLDESKKNLVEDMAKLSSPSIKQLQETMADLVARKAAFEAQLLGEGYQVEGNPQLDQMENRLNGIKEKIVEETRKLITRDLTNINPLDHSESLLTQILEMETTQASLQAKRGTLKSIVDEYTWKLETLPDKSLGLARMERDIQVNSKLYVMLREKYEETRIREAGQEGIIRVVDLAELPTKAILPRTRLNILLGLFFGILLSVGLAFGREYFENSVRSEDDLREMDLHVIGGVPCIKKGKFNSSRGSKQKEWHVSRARGIFPYLLTHQNGNSTVAEAYRAIRTSIYFSAHQKQWKTILLTSPGPGDGKSTTAANVAITMAQKGVKTLLVDSDLRRPVLDILFIGVNRKIGLTNYLGREVEWKEAVRETTVEGLHLLTAGIAVKNASEILSSKTMLSLIEEMKREYGIVIFDSPPLLPVTDATVLASVVDGVVLVVRAEKTSKEGVKRSIDLLRSVGAKVLGAVLTGVHSPDLYEYRDYYSHYLELTDK